MARRDPKAGRARRNGTHGYHSGRRDVCRYTASVTSPGGRLCPRIRLPSRVVQPDDVDALASKEVCRSTVALSRFAAAAHRADS